MVDKKAQSRQIDSVSDSVKQTEVSLATSDQPTDTTHLLGKP